VCDNSALFIEVKAKKVTASAKTIEFGDKSHKRDLEVLANSVVQLYKTIRDYEIGLYPSLPFRSEMEVFPIVVTLEPWHIFGPKTLESIENSVRSKLILLGMDPSMIEKMPFSICDLAELEHAAQVIDKVGVGEIVKQKLLNPEYRRWELIPYLKAVFPDEMRESHFLFDGEFPLN